MHHRPPRHLTDQQRFARAGRLNVPVPQTIAVPDNARFVQSGKQIGPVRPVAHFARKTHFVVDVENHVRYNTAELMYYQECIRKTLAYTGKDGYSRSPDQNIHVRNPDVTTWNPAQVLAPAVAPLFYFPPNLWDEFVDGTGPQNSAFLNEHPITADLKYAMRDDVDRLLFLLYDKYDGRPGTGAEYVDMQLAFGPIQFLAALDNRNKSFVGSANMSGFVAGNKLTVVVSDVKSAYSLAAHATHKVDHYRSSRLSMYGFTYQFYIWSVGMKDYEWYKRRRNMVDIKGRKKDWFGINPAFLPK